MSPTAVASDENSASERATGQKLVLSALRPQFYKKDKEIKVSPLMPIRVK